LRAIGRGGNLSPLLEKPRPTIPDNHSFHSLTLGRSCSVFLVSPGMCEMGSLRSIMGNPEWASLLRVMNGDAEQSPSRAVSVSWINGPTKLPDIHTVGGRMQATPRPWGKFSRVTNWVCSRCLHIKRYAFIFPFCLYLHWSSRYLYVVFVHSLARPFTILTSYHIRSVFKLHLFHNMKFFTVLSALGLVAAVAAQHTTQSSTVASSTLATSTSASLTPEQSCLANCKLQAS
jgi:hypothetical protein